MDSIYFDCDIESGCISREFPWECLREFRFPGTGCQVSNRKVNQFVASFLYGACGKVINPCLDTALVEEATDVVPLTQTFKCELLLDNDGGHGVWKVEYNYQDSTLPGIVLSSPKCGCFLFGDVDPNLTWSNIMRLKFESPFTAACRIGFFFLRRLNYMPIDITCGDREWESTEYSSELFQGFSGPIDGERAIVVLHYHKRKGEELRQLLKVRMVKRNGGWYTEDPVRKDSRLQKKKCFRCNYHNGSGDEYRLMFGLDCGRHTVCEECVFIHFGGKKSSVECQYSFNRVNYCNVCQCDTRSIVTVALQGLSEMKCPVPIGYIGMKPVFNPYFLKEFGEFYKLHIEWMVLANAKAISDYNGCVERIEESMRQLKASRNNCAGVDDWYRITQRVHQERNAKSLFRQVQLFTEYKRYVVEWLLKCDGDYPVQFLQQDRCYYENKLNRNHFKVAKRRADISKDMICNGSN